MYGYTAVKALSGVALLLESNAGAVTNAALIYGGPTALSFAIRRCIGGVPTDVLMVDHDGNLEPATGATFDGVDVSAHAAAADAHHSRYTDGEALAAVESAIDADIAAHAAVADAHHAAFTQVDADARYLPTTGTAAGATTHAQEFTNGVRANSIGAIGIPPNGMLTFGPDEVVLENKTDGGGNDIVIRVSESDGVPMNGAFIVRAGNYISPPELLRIGYDGTESPNGVYLPHLAAGGTYPLILTNGRIEKTTALTAARFLAQTLPDPGESEVEITPGQIQVSVGPEPGDVIVTITDRIAVGDLATWRGIMDFDTEPPPIGAWFDGGPYEFERAPRLAELSGTGERPLAVDADGDIQIATDIALADKGEVGIPAGVRIQFDQVSGNINLYIPDTVGAVRVINSTGEVAAIDINGDANFDGAVSAAEFETPGVTRYTETTAPSTPDAADLVHYAEDDGGHTVARIKFDDGHVATIAKAGGLQTYSPIITALSRAFDASTVTLEELANVLGSLIEDLQAAGLLS
jgi:hypothetical protein